MRRMLEPGAEPGTGRANRHLLALDVMGGDHAPEEPCRGALLACQEHPDLEIALVGDPEAIRRHLEKAPGSVRGRLHLVPAEETIGMDEVPTLALRKKRRSSLRIAMEMVHSREVDGCVSAGNTGAIVAGGVLVVGRIPGIDRPGLGIPLPALERLCLLLDVGATVRCKPLNLFQFALMGGLYMKALAGVENPSVALLSNGTEEIKGDEVVLEARDLLRASSLNYVGFVEGKDVPRGPADVVVCDGFTGNALLKFAEGLGEVLYTLFREEVDRRLLAKAGVLFMIPALKNIWRRLDYERQGGSPLLGVDGAVVKAHGRSNAAAIAGALRVAANFVRGRGIERIREELERTRSLAPEASPGEEE